MSLSRRLVPVASSVILACAATMSRAQTDVSLLLESWTTPGQTDLQAEAIGFPNSHLDNGADVRIGEFNSSGRFRLSRDRELNPTVGYDFALVDVVGNQNLVPRQLLDTSVAFATPVWGDRESFVGVLGGVGYAGDDPFGDGKAWYGKADVVYGRKLSKDEDLLLFVEYDGNRSLMPDVPLPGFAYVNHASDQFQYVLGFPETSLRWKPRPDWWAELQWDVPDSFDASVHYRPARPIELFAGYSNTVDAFHVRAFSPDRRLLFQEQRAEAGVTYRPKDGIDLTAAVGWAFSRTFESGFDVRTTSRVSDLSDEPYFRLSIAFRF